MDHQSFCDGLMAALPEAFTDPEEREQEPLSYLVLGSARIWLEENALIVDLAVPRARVRPDHAEAFRRFWDFIERQAERATDDRDLKNLLQIECFEGVGWVEDVLEYVGPATRALLVDAQERLAAYNEQVGRWAQRRPPRKPRR